MDYTHHDRVSFPGPSEFAAGSDFRESDALDPLQLAAVTLTGKRMQDQGVVQ